MNTDIYMTVKDLKALCEEMEKDGLGDYGVGCDQAYCFAKKDDKPDVDKINKVVHFGLYTDLYT